MPCICSQAIQRADDGILKLPVCSVSFLAACQSSTDRKGGQAVPSLCNQCWGFCGGPTAIPDYSQNVRTSYTSMTLMRRNGQGFVTHPEPRTSSAAHRRDLWCPQDWPITTVYSLTRNITALTVIWLQFCLQEREECLSGDNVPGVGGPKCFTNSVVPPTPQIARQSSDCLRRR